MTFSVTHFLYSLFCFAISPELGASGSHTLQIQVDRQLLMWCRTHSLLDWPQVLTVLSNGREQICEYINRKTFALSCPFLRGCRISGKLFGSRHCLVLLKHTHTISSSQLATWHFLVFCFIHCQSSRSWALTEDNQCCAHCRFTLIPAATHCHHVL